MARSFLRNKKGMSIVISTIIIVAISITMAISVAFWAMGVSNSFTKFEKLEIISMYVSDTSVSYARASPPPLRTLTCYRVFMQLKNTGTNTLTINNVFLDGKPYNAAYPEARVPGGQLAYQNLVPTVMQTGQTLTSGSIWLPVGGMWNSGDYVTIEIETSAGRHYPYTVVLP